MTKKTAIITGINGQLGQYLCKHLLEQNVRVIGALRHKTARNETYIFPQDQVTFELMDLSDPHSIETLVQTYKPDYFINTAANAFVGESWRVPVQHMEINAIAVLHQLEAIRKHSPQTRYLNLGTSEEFGDVKYTPQDEKHPQSPRSPYGASKCAARHLVKVWRESYGLYALQVWCFNFESPLRDEKYVTRKITKGVARIAAAIQKGQPFEPIELGNLDVKRAWQHASSVADGIWRMLNQEPPADNVAEVTINGQSIPGLTPLVLGWDPQEYVLSSDSTHTVREFINRAFWAAGFHSVDWSMPLGATGPESEVGYADGHLVVRINPAFYRPVEVDLLLGSSTRARTELGWSPKHSFDDLVTEMVLSDLAAVGITS